MARKTGARGLRSILEKVMLDIMYELPSRETIKELLVTEEVVKNHLNPWMVLEGGQFARSHRREGIGLSQ